jgi:hypothetical protein
MIANSDELLVAEKAVAHFALDAILDGSFPPSDGLVHLEKAFGPEFANSIRQLETNQITQNREVIRPSTPFSDEAD